MILQNEYEKKCNYLFNCYFSLVKRSRRKHVRNKVGLYLTDLLHKHNFIDDATKDFILELDHKIDMGNKYFALCILEECYNQNKEKLEIIYGYRNAT